MFWMGLVLGIKVAACVFEVRSSADVSFVNVQGEKACGCGRQTPHMDRYDSPLRMRKEFCPSPEFRCTAPAVDICLYIHRFVQIDHPCHFMNGRGERIIQFPAGYKPCCRSPGLRRLQWYGYRCGFRSAPTNGACPGLNRRRPNQCRPDRWR